MTEYKTLILKKSDIAQLRELILEKHDTSNYINCDQWVDLMEAIDEQEIAARMKCENIDDPKIEL